MACTRFEYVKKFEKHEQLLPQTYTVVRVDGKGFTKFCEKHKFHKPNDIRCIQLMSAAAEFVIEKFQDVFLAYGQSDEYSFALKATSELFNRRSEKISTCITSCFSSAFVFQWGEFFPGVKLREPPIFDGRCVSYPNLKALKDYFRWRQADCHINNLYNTAFWCMVKGGRSNTEVESILKDTNSGDKNEILFRDFGINYNNIEEVYRKGTIIAYFVREDQPQIKISKGLPEIEKNAQQKESPPTRQVPEMSQPPLKQTMEVFATQPRKEEEVVPTEDTSTNAPKKKKLKFRLEHRHIDLIRQQFWQTIRVD